jgi:hypothetical protein
VEKTLLVVGGTGCDETAQPFNSDAAHGFARAGWGPAVRGFNVLKGIDFRRLTASRMTAARHLGTMFATLKDAPSKAAGFLTDQPGRGRLGQLAVIG